MTQKCLQGFQLQSTDCSSFTQPTANYGSDSMKASGSKATSLKRRATRKEVAGRVLADSAVDGVGGE